MAKLWRQSQVIIDHQMQSTPVEPLATPLYLDSGLSSSKSTHNIIAYLRAISSSLSVSSRMSECLTACAL